MNKPATLSRRQLLSAGAGAALMLAAGGASAAPLPTMQVWKDPGCGCCKDWIKVLQKDGFSIEAHDSGNVAARKRLKLADKYASCHTALIGGYVVEGHVPAKDIRRLLKEKPDALGIAAPGMPVGSPGMDGPAYQGRKDPHDVVLVLKDGSARIWASYR